MDETTARQEPRMRLREPRNRVSRTAVRYWTVRAAAGWFVVLAAEAAWWLLGRDEPAVPHVIVAIVTVLACAAHLAVMPRWRYLVHRWETTEHAVYTQAGWFDQERRIAPMSRIQTVDSERGPLEQLFGLASVTVTTASAAGPLQIRGLDHETAMRLVEDLTTATEATRGDAT